jgi:hypothetical protein
VKEIRPVTIATFCEQGYQYEIHDFDETRRKKLAEWSCPELPFPANDGATE